MTENEYLGDPWTIGTELRMRAKNPDALLISLLTDEAGAILIAQGKVPAYLRQQALEALEWSATPAREATPTGLFGSPETVAAVREETD